MMSELYELLASQTDKRKIRLFSVACCRRAIHLMRDERSMLAIYAAENFADNLISKEQLNIAENNAIKAAYADSKISEREKEIYHSYELLADFELAISNARFAAFYAAKIYPNNIGQANSVACNIRDALCFAADIQNRNNVLEQEEQHQLDIFYDIFPNPYKNLIVPTNPLLVSIAKNMYKTNNFADLPILHDVLLDAGCQDKYVLNHTKEKTHTKGCFLIDLILGKK